MAVLLALLVAAQAHAELYRWRDPQTGSVKLSNLPPPWYGDPVRETGFPRVEVVPDLSPRSRAMAPAPRPEAKAGPGALSTLEAQFAALLKSAQALPASADPERAGAALRERAEAYRALSAELDRMDPAGAARRRAMAQESGLLPSPAQR